MVTADHQHMLLTPIRGGGVSEVYPRYPALVVAGVMEDAGEEQGVPLTFLGT